MGKVESFKDLVIWQKAMELVKRIYQMTAQFPPAETYGLTTQMRRSAISIPSNVAEGFRRNYHKEFKQFVNISRGSLAELETQALIAQDLKYTHNPASAEVFDLMDQINRMITNLLKTL